MIPYFPAEILGPSVLENSLKALFSHLSSSETTCCITELNINKYIPYWVIQEKEDRGGDTLTIFDFIQKYYDWLYCSDSCGGSGYVLENKLLDIIDIDKTQDLFFKRLSSAYFGDYNPDEGIEDINGDLITKETIAKFINGIKVKFNVKRGSFDGLQYFFTKLFSVDPNDITVYYPKKYLLRLNGGAFHHDQFTFYGHTGDIPRSLLNHERLQDGDWFHDYSYVLKTGLTADNYGDFYIRALHPAGINGILEQSIDNYLPPGASFEGEILSCETPLLENYSVYKMNVIYATDSVPEYKQNVGGLSFYGLNYFIGCSLGGSFGAAPAFLFPVWANSMSYTNFFDIPLFKMFALCYINNTVNPNVNLQCP